MELLKHAIQQRIGSGLAASYGDLDALSGIASQLQWPELYVGKTSHLANADAITARTVFDLASLTKILATTSIYMMWTDQGVVDVDAPLETYLPEAKQHTHLRELTLAQLLSHTSGLPAWKPFYEDLRTHFGENLPFLPISSRKERFFQDVYSAPLENEPGTKTVYSDLGFLILGALAEKISGKTLDVLARELVWAPIGSKLHYRPVVMDTEGERYRIRMAHESVAMTEDCPWRGLVQGQVHDDGAWSMGGVAGHAGVFGTLNDVKIWAKALLEGRIASYATLRKFTQEVLLKDGSSSRRTLGFDMPALDGNGTTAFAYSSTAVGHLGFTGTSLWLDLDRGRGAVLLTNRVHPSRNDLRIRNLRREFHTQVG